MCELMRVFSHALNIIADFFSGCKYFFKKILDFMPVFRFDSAQKSHLRFLGVRHSVTGPSTRMISSPMRRMQHHGIT